MKSSNKRVSIVALFLVVLVGSKAFVDGAGECGKTPIGSAASSLLPCLSAARNVKVRVPRLCCSKVNALIKSSPKCLCAVLLSPLAKLGGINPAIAVTIPKRCNIKNRQAGKKCGKYTIP